MCMGSKEFMYSKEFQGRKIKLERNMILCGCYTDKRLFMVYTTLKNYKKYFYIRSLNNMHTCESLDDNSKIIEAWIARKYHNKMLADLSVVVNILTDDMKIIHKVIIFLQKVSRANRRILKSSANVDYVESFKSL